MTDDEIKAVARYLIGRLDADTRDALKPGNKGQWRGAFQTLELLGLIEEAEHPRYRYTPMGNVVRHMLEVA